MLDERHADAELVHLPAQIGDLPTVERDALDGIDCVKLGLFSAIASGSVASPAG